MPWAMRSLGFQPENVINFVVSPKAHQLRRQPENLKHSRHKKY